MEHVAGRLQHDVVVIVGHRCPGRRWPHSLAGTGVDEVFYSLRKEGVRRRQDVKPVHRDPRAKPG